LPAVVRAHPWPDRFSRAFLNAQAGVDPRNEPSPSPDRPNFSNFQLGWAARAYVIFARLFRSFCLLRNSGMSDGAGEETVHVADSADDNPLWTADFDSSDAQNALQHADEQGKNSSSDEDD
jgi:hypothetical protein